MKSIRTSFVDLSGLPSADNVHKAELDRLYSYTKKHGLGFGLLSFTPMPYIHVVFQGF